MIRPRKKNAIKAKRLVERINGNDKRGLTYFSYHLLLDLVDVGENVGIAVIENLKCNGAVVVFKWRLIVVANCQLRLGVDLISMLK
jgi:NADH dehydrogenase FAD-containing subunit